MRATDGTTPLADIKSARRAEAKARRALLLENRAAAAAAVAATALPALARGAVVSGYVPQPDEFDVTPLMDRLRAEGHVLALPVVAGRGRPLVFRAWHETDALEPAALGIPIPPGTAPELRPELVLVPFLEIDANGYRLGYGGGYYDRTLAALRASGPVLAIAVGFAGQIVDHVPHDAHDARVDAILTEDGLAFTPFRLADAAQ